MHRYPAVSGGSGVGSSTSGGVSRELVRPDLGYSTQSNFSLTSRRSAPLTPYALKCDQEPLSARLGPPDYFPPTPNCAEESLSRDACQNGYKETVYGIEESKETLYTLVNQPVWSKPSANKYKETIRKRLNALNKSQLRKRKAGQVYGVPLSGPLLAKSGTFPEQRHSGEDNRKKWIEDLAQHKRLKVLADHVPLGLRRRPLFEALIRHHVPFLRATWCIKVLYLNQVRPLSIGMSSGGGDKSQQKRVELWTKDVLEYMQCLLDEQQAQLGGQAFGMVGRENCELLDFSSTSQQATDFTQGRVDHEDTSLQKKWLYMLQLFLLHFSEGLLHRTPVIDWLLKQLQERESLEAAELLLPIILNLIDEISSCQTLVRTSVDIFLNKLGNLCSAGKLPDAVEQPRQHYVATFFVELLSYMLAAVPDTFVALDCFPLPPCIVGRSRGASDEFHEIECSTDFRQGGVVGVSGERASLKLPSSHTSGGIKVNSLAETVQKRAASLAKAVNPASLRKNEGIVVQTLDRALITGDIHTAYNCMFDDDFCGHEQLPDEWIAKVGPWLKLSPALAGDASLSEVFAVSFLCEWAICDFRDCRKVLKLSELKTASIGAICRVHMAVSVLCLRSEELRGGKYSRYTEGDPTFGAHATHSCGEGSQSKACNFSSFFESPGPIHDIITVWLDQHDTRKGARLERLQMLLWELARKGLFCPPAYVRKLIVSGVLEKKESSADLERAARHKCLLQLLPLPQGLTPNEDGRRPSDLAQKEALRIFKNERHFCLAASDQHHARLLKKPGDSLYFQQPGHITDGSGRTTEVLFPTELKSMPGRAERVQKRKMKVLELKQAVAQCLRFPEWCFKDQAEPMHEKPTSRQKVSKRQLVPQGSSEKPNPLSGCDECVRTKKVKNNDGDSIFIQSVRLQGEEDDAWWVKKVAKPTTETVKPEAISVIKPPKQPLRGRPKAVRKVSLAQLDGALMDTSQGASSSHTCDGKVNCSHHGAAVEVAAFTKERKKFHPVHDLTTVCSSLKRLRLTDKRAIAIWLDETVRLLVEGDNVASVSTSLQHTMRPQLNAGSSAPNCERSSVRWHFGDEELANIVCLLDITNDFITLIRLLLWLLPKASISYVSSPGQNVKIAASPWYKGSACKISESMILTCLQRYESVLLASNLLSEALSTGMQRAGMLLTSGLGNRISCGSLFAYTHDLLKKYGKFRFCQIWEAQWKGSHDQRLAMEFEAWKAAEGETKLSLLGVNSPSVGDDRDECLPPRSMGRLRPYMRDIVRKGFQEVINQMVSKERELSTAIISKELGNERWSEGLQAAQNVVTGLLECIKQQAGNTPNGDLQLAAAATSAVVHNAVTAIAGVFENLAITGNSFVGVGSSGISASAKCCRRILQAHVHCLRLFKENLGEKLSRTFESALTLEAHSMVANASGHTSGRAPRSQFALSPDTPDLNAALGDLGVGSNGSILGRSNTVAASAAALLVCLVLEDIVTLEKAITLFKIKDGIESMHFSKGGMNSNGMSRLLYTGNSAKSESVAEVSVFWFRVLIGDCRSVACGLIHEVVGESCMQAFLHRQRLLPLSTVFLPAYSLFLISLRGQPSSMIVSNREEAPFQQLAQTAIGDLLVHDPFRVVCLKDTQALYQLLTRESGDYEYASLLDSKGADVYTKMSSMVPSRPRLFLHAVLDCQLPTLQIDESYVQSRGNMMSQSSLVEELVQVLDDIHPATFHWQWLELRLLLNEQVFMEKLESQNMSVAAEAVQAAKLAIEDGQSLSECEKNFTEILLTRLLVRPDAAALYSEALHLLGRALEDYLILQVQWVLENSEMLLGKKFLRQQLEEMAHRKKFKLNVGKIKVWEWSGHHMDESLEAGETNRKAEAASLEEGEVAEEDLDCSKQPLDGVAGSATCSHSLRRHFAVEKALTDLVLPCLARSSSETYSRFASRLVKQISDLEQQVTVLGRACGKSVVGASEGGANKRFGPRKGSRPPLEPSNLGLGRWTTSVTDSSPPSAAALQTSLWLRLRFLLLLLPPIYSDREQQTGRSMRSVLAPVLLRLLGTRFVQESVDAFCFVQGDALGSSGRDLEWNATAGAAAAAVASGEDLFDRILSVLHALLSNSWAVWLKQKSKPFKPPREVPSLDREIVHRMQADLDHMQLPSAVRARLQAAMPILAPSPAPTISAGPPQVQAAALPVLQMCLSSINSSTALGSVNSAFKLPGRLETNAAKVKPPAIGQEPDTELDPWTLLGDANSSGGSGTGVLVSCESGNNKACSWLKGAVRIRRTDLTYVGSLDDDS